MNLEPKSDTGIAIVGMAGRFPGARNIEEFWRNLCAGVESVSFFTDVELAAAGVEFPRDKPNYVKARGVLAGADEFDAAFFGMNPREAEIIDPQHRVFLECAWEALESAGCDPEKFDGAIGVFAGVSLNTYLAHNLMSHPDLVAQLNEHQLMLGNDKDFLPTRVSYKLNLRGPSVNIQTACSTSLVAVCVACSNLLSGECDLALAGAVSILFPQKRGYLYQEGGIASPDGHCRAFDAQAAGTVAGEGAAIVVLKRLADALADGDTVYAVIKGFAVNNDGANKIGYTAPGVDGQAEVIATAQAMADFAPETISYIETHGTGTPLGDPIEIEGLTKAFRAGTNRKQFCAIGSVKSNVGHLDVAAGVAGLIKTALALYHKEIPPSLHFASPNPKIDFAGSPFFVNAKLTDWPGGELPRRAGVSSFGIGGTNAHVVLEEAAAMSAPGESKPVQLVLLSAKTEAALEQATVNLAAHLKQDSGLNLADVAYTLQVGRRAFPHRRMLVGRDLKETTMILETRDTKRVFSRVVEKDCPPVVFMFPGQGAQQVNMGRELYECETVFREQVDLCSEKLRTHLGFDLRTVLYPESGNLRDREADNAKLTQTTIAQPALFVVEYALAQLWLNWGVQPEAMIGHSLGEYVAACLAGVFTLEDALVIVAARGRLMQEQPGGTMLAVRLPETEVLPLLNEQLSLAAVNAPSLSVVSGPGDSIAALQRTLTERAVAGTLLPTSHAFHSAMMEPVRQSFPRLMDRIKLQAPQIPFISNVTGTWITAKQATDAGYWAEHLRRTVRFADGLTELFRKPARTLLEIGPGPTLAGLARQHPACRARTAVVASLPRAKDAATDLEIVSAAAGQLWLSGVEIDWKNFHRKERRRRVWLPPYPFERKRYFIEPARPIAAHRVSVTTETRYTESSETVSLESPLPAEPATGREKTAETLRGLLLQLSGMNPNTLDGATTFAELGLESLFLTQFSVALEKQFGVRVAFRELLGELSTLDALAAHLETDGGQHGETGTPKLEIPISDSEMDRRLLASTTMIPLTEAQQELWLASQISDAASCAYNECRLLHLHGTLKANTLCAAVQTLVDRHEALRIVFTPDGSSQRIQPALKLDVPLLDWSGLASGPRAMRLAALQEEEAQTPFDLSAGPLLRARLIRLEEEHHVLALTVHHIACDGYSLGILLRELAECYSAGSRDARPRLPVPPPWSEYVRRQSPAAGASQDEAFWLAKFSASPPALELPSDLPRPPAWTFDGARESLRLPETLGVELKRLSARQGGTLFTTLLAVYGVLLHRLSGQDEIVIGIPAADRATAGGDSLVGHCVNFLPLPLKFDGDEPFAENLARVQKDFLEAYAHQHCTFGRMLQHLNLARDASRMPLVSVTFNVQRLRDELKFPGLEMELDANPLAATHFDLGFDVTEIGGVLQVNCRYNRSLFSAETIRRWLGHFQTLLEGAVANPSEIVGRLPLLTEAQWHQALVEWNPAPSPVGNLDDKCLHQLFEEQAERTPDAVAVTFEEVAVTYGELNRRADGLAEQLRRLGVGPEVVVGLCLERSPAMVTGILAILKAGGAYLPLDPVYPRERLDFMLRDARAPVLLTQQSLRDRLKFEIPNLRLCCVDEWPAATRRPQPAAIPHSAFRVPHSDDLAYVIYTSGSTGRPKGVTVMHRNVTRLLAATQPTYQFNAQDVWTLFHSCAFDFSVWEIWGALLHGGRLVIVPYLTSRSPKAFLELLARERVTVLNQTPSAFRQLIQAESDAGRRLELALRYVIFGGEALEMQSLKPWFDRHGGQRPRLVNMYGITETTVHVTCRPVNTCDLEAGSLIGLPIPGWQVYLLDAQRQPVPVGVPGEIHVGGAGLARGYLNRPELTAERFIADPFSRKPGAKLYKSGDLARRLPNGDLEYLGRRDHQVKIRGHRIELGEIESALNRHSTVRDCAVIVREDSPGDQRLVAYVISKSEIETDALRNFLKTRLPDYMVPAALVFVDTLPLTLNGKLDRRALPLPDTRSTDAGKEFAAPGTRTEIALAAIWCEFLRLERVGVHDNFFDLGGHSLLMTQIITRMRETFSVEVPVRLFFESPTIAGLGAAIEQMVIEEIDRLSEEEADELARRAD